MMPAAAGDDFAPDLAIELIEEFGVEETWVIDPSPNFDQVAGEATPGAPVNVTVTITPPLQYKKEFFDGDVKLNDVSYCFIRGDVSFTPRRAMKIVINGETWNVRGVKPLVSGRKTAAYTLYVTR